MKHHYIPKFYLKQWEGKDKRLQVFWRRSDGLIVTDRFYRKGTGYGIDIYKMPGVPKETEHKIESAFMQLVDDQAVNTLNKLLGNKMPDDARTRHAWARFVLSLTVRNPEELKKFVANYTGDLLAPNEDFQRRYEAAKKEDDPDTLEEWMLKEDPTHPERAALLALTNLIVNPRVLKLFRTMHWTVIDTSSVSRRLMTSDRPVMLTAGGMVHYKGHYALPISPTRLFLASTAVQFADEFCANPVGKIVRTVNELVIGQARRWVYAVDDTPLAQVRREMGKMEPPSLIRGMGNMRTSRNYVDAKRKPLKTEG